MEATSALALLFNTKQQNRHLALKLISDVKEGNIDALKLHCYVKSIESFLNQFLDSKGEFKKEYSSLVLGEATKWGKSFEMYGCKVRVNDGKPTYDYSKCEDVILDDLQAQFESIKYQLEMRQKMLQNIPLSGMVDPENGNMIYPPVKSSPTIVSVQLPNI
jgi:hypothetical protein